MMRMNVPKTLVALGFVGAMLTVGATPTMARDHFARGHFIRGPVAAFNAVVSPFAYGAAAVVSPFAYGAYAYDPYMAGPRWYRSSRSRGYGTYREPFKLWDPQGLRWE